MSASLAYFDSYRTAGLPQNLTQAPRDYFGAHTYQRIERPDAGFVHTHWQALIAAAATGFQAMTTSVRWAPLAPDPPATGHRRGDRRDHLLR